MRIPECGLRHRVPGFGIRGVLLGAGLRRPFFSGAGCSDALSSWLDRRLRLPLDRAGCAKLLSPLGWIVVIAVSDSDAVGACFGDRDRLHDCRRRGELVRFQDAVQGARVVSVLRCPGRRRSGECVGLLRSPVWRALWRRRLCVAPSRSGRFIVANCEEDRELDVVTSSGQAAAAHERRSETADS
jgi:hypothetical protein